MTLAELNEVVGRESNSEMPIFYSPLIRFLFGKSGITPIIRDWTRKETDWAFLCIFHEFRKPEPSQFELRPEFRKAMEKLDLAGPITYPDEVRTPELFIEGACKRVTVNAYERDRRAREAAVKEHGCFCSVCDMSFEAVYGERGRGFIHVHHLKDLASIGREYVVNPKIDLRPVCANCHAMLHRGEQVLSISDLREIVLRQRGVQRK